MSNRRSKNALLIGTVILLGIGGLGYVVWPKLWLRYQIQNLADSKSSEERRRIARNIVDNKSNTRILVSAYKDPDYDHIQESLAKIILTLAGNDVKFHFSPEEGARMIKMAFETYLTVDEDTSDRSVEIINVPIYLGDKDYTQSPYEFVALYRISIIGPNGKISNHRYQNEDYVKELKSYKWLSDKSGVYDLRILIRRTGRKGFVLTHQLDMTTGFDLGEYTISGDMTFELFPGVYIPFEPITFEVTEKLDGW